MASSIQLHKPKETPVSRRHEIYGELCVTMSLEMIALRETEARIEAETERDRCETERLGQQNAYAIAKLKSESEERVSKTTFERPEFLKNIRAFGVCGLSVVAGFGILVLAYFMVPPDDLWAVFAAAAPMALALGGFGVWSVAKHKKE